MENTELIEVVNQNGDRFNINLITYLTIDDGLKHYIVYSKNEDYGIEKDKIIYVSKLLLEDGVISISEIIDDVEWVDVQKLLRRIANAA